MDFVTTIEYIKKDIYRNIGEYNKSVLIKKFFSKATTVNLLIHYRLCHYYVTLKRRNCLQTLVYYFLLYRYKRLQIYCGVELNHRTEIGYGLRLPHKGAIVIHPNTRIGNNCEIMSCVTIGNNIFKSRDEVPTIGNNVMICSGARIIGKIVISDDVVIGANSVVNKDIASGVVVAGAPAKVIHTLASKKYLINLN